MIFYALSDAAYRVSLHQHGPGAELEGGLGPPPPTANPARRVGHRAAARRGLKRNSTVRVHEPTNTATQKN